MCPINHVRKRQVLLKTWPLKQLRVKFGSVDKMEWMDFRSTEMALHCFGNVFGCFSTVVILISIDFCYIVIVDYQAWGK